MSSADIPLEAGWISVRHVRHMISRGELAGVATLELLAECGLHPSDLANPDGIVAMSTIETMLVTLTERYQEPLLGLQLARHIQPAALGAAGLLFQSCATVADMLQAVVRYNGLLSNIGKTSLEFGPGIVNIRWDCLAGGPLFRRHATEYVLGIFASISSAVLGKASLQLLAVHFSHAPAPRPANSRDYFATFNAPVHFSQPYSALVLPLSALKHPLPHDDQALRDLLERHAQELLQQRGQPIEPLIAVRQLIKAMLPGGLPTKDAIAAQLGLSGRSLHRKLQDSGTTYQHVLDEVRLSCAEKLLQESNKGLGAIADQLGFSSHQAFLRWFKVQTGKTPGEFRQQPRENNP